MYINEKNTEKVIKDREMARHTDTIQNSSIKIHDAMN